MTDQTKGLLITLFGALAIVPDSLFVRLIDADALVIAFWRSLLVGLLIGLWVTARRGITPFRAVLGAGLPGLVYMLAVGGSGLLFVLAVSLTSVANVVFIIAGMPVFAALFSWLFLGEAISRRMAWTMAAVIAGISIIAYGSGETHGATWQGNVLALAVTMLFAAGLTAARRARSVSMVPGVAMAYIGVAAGLALVVDPWAVPRGNWHFVGLHGLFIATSAVGLAIGPRFITSAEVALLILLESVCAPLLAWAVIGENPGPYALIGGAVVIGALAISNAIALTRRRQPVA